MISTPRGYQLAGMHSNLGVAFRSQFKRTGRLDDLNRAIAMMEQAATMCPEDHPDCALYLTILGETLKIRFEGTESIDDLQRAIKANEQAVGVVTAPPFFRIIAAGSASRLLIGRDHYRARPLLRIAVNLLPIISSRTLTENDRQYNISQFGGITSMAVSVSLDCQEDSYNALQLLEVGRGVLASLQIEVRSDLSSLKALNRDLAVQFENIRDQLGRQQDRIGIEPTKRNYISKTERRRLLSQQFDNILRTIRTLEGFERFLLGPSEAELMSLSGLGTIVIFNVSDIRSDAFLVNRYKIRSLPLPSLKQADLEVYTQRFLSAINSTSIKVHSSSTRELSTVLEWLWDAAVGPILNELGYTQTPSSDLWPRVWWVGSGLLNILPIHAAGYHYAGSNRTAIDRVISSYTATVKSLAYARENLVRLASPKVQKTLLVAMPTTPDHDNLKFVAKEINELKNLLPSTTVLQQPKKEIVVSILPDHQIVHFSCHGLSSATDPSQSRLLLDDWKTSPLTVSDLTALNVGLPQLAFLSACHTASTRDLRLLDESINLASAFHLIGFPSVIGTLWQVSDEHAPEIVKDVYKWMLAGGDRLDTQLSAVGLHRAVRALRNKTSSVPGFTKQISNPLIWAPYIHLGV